MNYLTIESNINNALPVGTHIHNNHTHAFNIAGIEFKLLEYILGTLTKKKNYYVVLVKFFLSMQPYFLYKLR